MLSIIDITDNFLSTKYYIKYLGYRTYKKDTVKKIFSLLASYYHETFNKYDILADELSESIEYSVKSYTSDKKTVLTVFRAFIKFIDEVYTYKINIHFPEIDISNSFERQMYIAKELQMSDKSVTDLSNELWVSERTLEDDIARLRGANADPIQVCGIPFVVNEVSRSKGRFSFSSTVHPIFLTYNITQIITMLKGLRIMYDNPLMSQYALSSAIGIWQQLSDYAKTRIIYVAKQLLPDDYEWYLKLENQDYKGMFMTENQCNRTEGAGYICDCLKNGKPCFIEYQSENGSSIFYENCIIKKFPSNWDTVLVECNGQSIQLDLSKIIRSAGSRDELI